MNTFSKKTAFGIVTAGVAAAALAAGIATPAMASTGHDSSTSNKADTSTSSTSAWTKGQFDTLQSALQDFTADATGGTTTTSTPVNLSPSVNVGDVASGNAIGSGNDSSLLSGNESAVGNNDSTGSVGTDVNKLVNGILSGNSASGSSSSSKSSSSQSSKGGLDLTNLLGSDDR